MVRFPDDAPTYRINEPDSPETKRILEQINRVNINLGYIKKKPQSQARYPGNASPYYGQESFQTYYQGSNNNYVPSIRRSTETAAAPTPRKIEPPRVVLVPDFVDLQTYVYPAHLLKSITLLEALKAFEPELMKKQNQQTSSKHSIISNKALKNQTNSILNQLQQRVTENESLRDKMTDRINIILVTLKQKETKPPARKSRSQKSTKHQKAQQAKAKAKTIFSTRPRPRPIGSNNIGSQLSKTPVTPASIRQENNNKGPLAALFDRPNEVVEAIKEGGIIIQRLRVKNGGIAIAGPNGIATAGSGGTAIVGPGGTAITHPKGLSIAGPGARVISVPETTDLKELALRMHPGEIPAGGRVVAHGPTIHYNQPVERLK